jgi:hypothetical protein
MTPIVALRLAQAEVVNAAIAYISLRDGLMNGHRSAEGRRLNAATKAYQLAAKAV